MPWYLAHRLRRPGFRLSDSIHSARTAGDSARAAHRSVGFAEAARPAVVRFGREGGDLFLDLFAAALWAIRRLLLAAESQFLEVLGTLLTLVFEDRHVLILTSDGVRRRFKKVSQRSIRALPWLVPHQFLRLSLEVLNPWIAPRLAWCKWRRG